MEIATVSWECSKMYVCCWWWYFVSPFFEWAVVRFFSLRELYVYKNVLPFYPGKHHRVIASVHYILLAYLYFHCDKTVCLWKEFVITHVSISVITISIQNALITPLILVTSLQVNKKQHSAVKEHESEMSRKCLFIV